METTKFYEYAESGLLNRYERALRKIAEISNVNNYYMKVEKEYKVNGGCWITFIYENPIQLYWFGRYVEKEMHDD